MISYAQNFEDVILWRAFKDVPQGFYVDVGAFDPEIDSVTKFFYDSGWSGVNIEPVPESFEALEAARPRDRNICAAAGSRAGVAELTIFPDSRGLSSFQPTPESAAINSKQLQVKLLPLKDILQPFRDRAIHFLKIDVEGSEREVLLGMDFQAFRPWIVVVEATQPLTRNDSSESWKAILTENQYHMVHFDGLNQFFLAAEHRELENSLRTPPNVFDQFEIASTARERRLRQEIETTLGADIATLKRCILALQGEREVLRTEVSSSQAAVTKLDSDLAELSQALRTNQEIVETIFKSRSWRWLAPIRHFNLSLKSYRQRLQTARLASKRRRSTA